MWRTVYLALISGFIAPLHLDADDHGAKGKVAPEKHAKAEPKCPDHVAKARPRTALGQPGRPNTSMSMPEFFMRMVIGDRLWERLPAATQAERSMRRAKGQVNRSERKGCDSPATRR